YTRALDHFPPFPTRRSSDLVGLDVCDPAGGLAGDASRVAPAAAVAYLLAEQLSEAVAEGRLVPPKRSFRGGGPVPPKRSFRGGGDRKSTRLNSSHDQNSYAV